MQPSSAEKRVSKNRFLTFNMKHPANPAFPALLPLKKPFLVISRKRILFVSGVSGAGFAGF